MKKISLIILLFFSIKVAAQKKISKHTPVITKGLYLSFNPHSIFEPQQGGIGLGVGYRISKRIEVWTEFNYLYKGFFQNGGYFDNLKGLRNITNFKYYYNNRLGFFVGADFRIKNYSFNDKKTFVNTQTNDTLVNFNYKPIHTVVGGAVFWGKRFKLTANGKFEMEANVGIGIKQKRIRRDVPDGYAELKYRAIDSFGPFFSYDEEDAYPYIPATFRFIYHL